MLIIIWILCVLQVCQCHHTILLNTQKDIRIVRASKKAQIVVKDLQEANAIDYLYQEATVCWVDHGSDHLTEEIACSSYNVSTPKVTLAKSGITYPDGIACDWLTRKLYWTDRGDTGNDIPAKIEVVSLETKFRKVLFWQDLDQPRGIAVDPLLGRLFWSDWGDSPRIESASMNGDPSSRRVIVPEENLVWPNGISLDIEAKRIYWVDGHRNVLEACDYSGNNREILWRTRHLPYAMGVSVGKDEIFWTDWKERSLYVLPRNRSASPSEVLHLPDPLICDVKVLDAQRQPYQRTPCEHNNGNCSHLCLLSSGPERFSCACPTGIKLLKDNVTCAERVEEFLLLVQWSEITRISLDTADLGRFVIPLKEVKQAVGIDFDPVEEYFYWTDQQLRNIRRARLDGSHQETVISQDVINLDGVAIDWLARNMYWCDSGANRIEMLRLKTRFRKTIIFEDLEEPRAVVVAPQHGWLFWSDWSEQKPKIERADLDGTNRLVLVDKDISWPNGLALDLDEEKVYWGDAKTDKIEVVNMDGSNRRDIVVENIPHIFGLSLLNDKLYWTDLQRRTLESAKKHQGRDRVQVLEMADLRGIKAVRMGSKLGANSCSTNNGGCDHFCVHKPDNRSVCVCQIDYELRHDNKTCALPEVSLVLYSSKNIRKVSIVNPRSQETIPIVNVKSISAIDVNVADDRLYWAETSNKMRSCSINRAFVNGSRVERLIEFGVHSPESLAVDWLSSNLYWADTGSKRIEVARLNGQYRRVLFWKGLREPRNLQLDPRVGLMFWSEWGGGTSNGAIIRAHMDGNQKDSIVVGVGRVNGLTIDYADRHLYWTSDANSVGTIERCNADGQNRFVIMSVPGTQPHSIANNQNSLFWLNLGNSSVMQVDKLSGRFQKVLFAQNEKVSDIRVVEAATKRSNGWNACVGYRCQYLCLVRPAGPAVNLATSPACLCPSHYTMHDGVCQPPANYLLFSQRSSLYRLTTSLNDCPDVPLPIPGLKGVRAIDYDPSTKSVYWIDGKSWTIRRAQENSAHAQVVFGNVESEEDRYVSGAPSAGVSEYVNYVDIALEPYSKLLFWSCSSTNTINVTRVNQPNVGGAIYKASDDEKPRNLALHPERGLLFWVNVGKGQGIVQSRLNGQQQYVIPTEDEIVNALAVDRKFHVLYFATKDKLYQYDLLDRKKVVVLHDRSVLGLAVMRSYLYLIDKDSKRIERLDKTSNDGRIVVVEHEQAITDLVSVTPLDDDVDLGHPCSVHNHFGNCSHLCLRAEDNFNAAECACPLGMHLSTDLRTCAVPQPCGEDHFVCRTSALECIPQQWRCDGTSDCADDSDEEKCSCARDEFQCDRGVCVPQSAVCDGVVDCRNGADELRNCAEERPRVGGVASDDNSNAMVVFALCLIVFFVVVVFAFMHCKAGFKRPAGALAEQDAVVMRPLAPDVCPQIGLPHSMKNGCGGGSGSSGIGPLSGGGSSGSYDRSHITGASSSISVNQVPLNPPPSPTTTILQEEFCCDQFSLPPHPTPCSTFVCDESDAPSAISSSYRRTPMHEPNYYHQQQQRHHHHHRSGGAGRHQPRHMRNRRTPSNEYYMNEQRAPTYRGDRMVDRSDYELPQPPPTPCSYASRSPSPISSIGRSSSPR